jgi:hypothetical protein
MYIGLHVKHSLFLSDFNETWIYPYRFSKKKSSNINFHENPSSGSRSVPCGQMTDMTKLMVSGFGGLEVACWPLEPKVAGSNTAKAVGFFWV